MKKFRFIVALLSILFASNTFAQKITAADVTIEPGKTADLQVSVEFTEPAWSAEFNIDLPEGITVESVSKNEEFLPSSKQVVEITGTKVIAYPSDYGEDVFASESGVFAILTLKAADDLAEGELEGAIKNGSIGDLAGSAFDTEDATFKITVKAGAQPYVEPEGTHQIEGGLGSLVAPKTYENIGAWGGTWSGNSIENERDWSKFDYLWIKYKDFSGAINFGIMYSEWVATQSWGEQFKDETVAIKDPSGVIGIKINHTDVYVNGNKPKDADGNPTGDYIGDTFSKHIREIFIQATSGGSNITIEEMWLGSEEDYLKAVEDNKWVDPTVYAAISDDKCYFSKEYPSTDIVASTVEDGVIIVNSPAKVKEDYDTQFWIWMTQKLPAGTQFKVTFDYKASENANIGNTQCHNEPGQYIHWQLFAMNFTTEWQTLSETLTVPNECNGEDHGSDGYKNDFHSIAFNLSKDKDITYYFKNIKIEIDETAVTEPEYFEPAPLTGIKSLNTAEKNGALYNLAGQKVDKNFKGIVIENGKKRMNK
ncbi:MAG: hypothetical protein J6W43_00050 [Prevotella sp.]|nr:hypothetical protein [Prevotella sp.]